MSLSNHTAPGQALGYYFQLERALSWISKAPAGTLVGIETEDDVVVTFQNGEKVYEQDKSSTSTYPFNLSRPDLWKTLLIWLKAIEDNEINLLESTFYLVTNATSVDSLAKKIGLAEKEDDLKDCITLLKEKAATLTGEVKALADKILLYSYSTLEILFKRIKYIEGPVTYGSTFKLQLINDLQLDVEAHEQNEAVIKELTGWVFEQVTESWRNKKPAFINRNEFMREKISILTRYRQSIVNEVIIGLGEIPKAKEIEAQNNKYVKQLNLIVCDDSEIKEAVHDYLNAVAKRTFLAKKGFLTFSELEEFDRNLKNRWDKIFKLTQLKYKSEAVEDTGKIIFYETMQCDTSIGNYKLLNHFLTRGTYHSLADKLEIGWHPKYRDLIN